MDKKMFCFQCEQTVGCTGCTGNAGVCGKKADTAKLQDELTGALISLAKAADSTETISKRTGQIIIEGLFTTVTNVSFDNAAIENMIQKVRAEKERLAPDCRTEEYDLQQLWNANEDIRSLKSLILFGIRGMAAYAYHANVLNYEDAEVNQFFCEALSKIGYEESTEALLSTVLKTGEINLKCMALLDKANTETYGTPEPTDVTLTVEKGPFIVVTGHDLKDLQLLLEQTEGKGINIYTHGEMLPAHAYPFLKKYSHLKGNFGTAWQNQQKEFDHLPAPILYTTNCLMPPKSSYADRVFTTEVVAFPGAVHIDEKKDFTPLIEKALELAPKAKVYDDYREILEDKTVDAVLVATPLNSHCQIVLDAFDAGKHVFCEKSIGFTMEECFRIYNKHISTEKVFFTGQQRLFDPRYIKAMEMIHAGTFGEINAIRTFWNRNGDWRREVPSPDLERLINWRLYREYSKGLMTELACHQLPIGSWALQKLPEKVMGHGAITYWKDGREVYDNVSCIYVFDDGVKMTFDSVISNKFYGLEEQIMGNLGTVEPEKGKYFFESVPPAPGFLQMINDWENKVFDSLPFAGTSWAPETANENKGEFILGERPKSDGTSLLLEAFVEAVITRRQPERIAEEGYYASMLCLLGDQALQEERVLYFPDEYKINYLNHQAKTPEAV